MTDLRYIYRGALYCEDCGDAIRESLADSWAPGAPEWDDSETYPQGDCNESWADSPCHCDECSELLDVGLTTEGRRYVAEALVERTGCDIVLGEWAAFFDFPDSEDWDQDALEKWAEELDDPEEALNSFEEAYQGEHSSPEDWAAEYGDSTGMLHDVPEHLQRYFDFEAFARDCEMGGDMNFVSNGRGGVYAFSNHW